MRLMVWVTALIVGAADVLPTSQPTASQPAANVWLTDFAQANRQSRLANKPLLALSGLKNCPYCEILEAVLADASVQERLRGFVLCRFDLEADAVTARAVGVDVAPALVAYAPVGVCVGRQEGAARLGEMTAWLDAALRKIAILSPESLDKDPKDLIGLLAAPDPVLREAAAEVLVSRAAGDQAGPTAAGVVEAFVSGGLPVRLGALELLSYWGAPLAGVDPWKPATVERAADELRRWARSAALKEVRKPSPEAITRDLDLWTTGEEGPRTRAAYERLARVGPDLIPQLRALTPPTWDRARERLTALVHRILLPRAVGIRRPEVPFQMADRDPAMRLKALAGVSEDVRGHGLGQAAEAFFLEAFTDADSKVREAALRGFRSAGAAFAKQQVLRFLRDPSPNVRATILNELVEAPLAEAAADLAAYAKAEPDEDLVVHAARALRPLRNAPVVFDTLVALTEHASWRVRAEAVEALGKESTRAGRQQDLPKEKVAVLSRAVVRALGDDDPFVVAKAIDLVSDLETVDVKTSLTALEALTERHPDLTLQALAAMSQHSGMRSQAVPHIKRLASHREAAVRAAAVRALVMNTEAPMLDTVLAGLADGEGRVRAAAAASLCEWIRGRMSDRQEVLNQIPADARRQLGEALRRLAGETDPEVRLAGLMALIAVGQADVAFPSLRELVVQSAAYAEESLGVVTFLDWPRRESLLLTLAGQGLSDRAWARLFGEVFSDAPPEAADRLWQVFETDPHVIASPNEVIRAILRFYKVRGDTMYELVGGVYRRRRESDEGAVQAGANLARRVRPHLKAAHPRRRIIALILLFRGKVEEGEAEAARMIEAGPGAGVEPEMRQAAVELLLTDPEKHEALAVRTLSDASPVLRLAALRSLLARFSAGYLSWSVHVGEEPIWMSSGWSSSGSPEPKAWEPPALPKDLRPAALRPFLDEKDEDLSLGAAYLLALGGEVAAADRIVQAWRRNKGGYRVRELFPRAVAALDLDKYVPDLKDLYASYDASMKAYYGRQLYWTIRRMSGPQAQAFRGDIRSELGTAIFQGY